MIIVRMATNLLATFYLIFIFFWPDKHLAKLAGEDSWESPGQQEDQTSQS